MTNTRPVSSKGLGPMGKQGSCTRARRNVEHSSRRREYPRCAPLWASAFILAHTCFWLFGEILMFPLGTSIQPFATFTGNSTVFMSIDNGAFTATFQRPESDYGNATVAIHHQALWIMDPLLLLPDGSHTLLINQISDLSNGTTFLDYLSTMYLQVHPCEA